MNSYRAMASAIQRACAEDVRHVLRDALAQAAPAATPPTLSPAQWEQLYAHLEEDDATP